MLSEKQWKIIELMAEKDRTPTELAKRLNVSLQAVDINMKKLEKMNLIKKTKSKKGKTRPFVAYTIGHFIYFMQAVPHKAQKKILEADDNILLHLNIWSIPQKEFHYFIEDYWWQIKPFWQKIAVLAVYGSVAKGNAREESDIDILILTNKKEKKLEKKCSTKMTGTKAKNKIVMAQIFDIKEFEGMLSSKSKLAQEIIKNSVIIYDPKNIFYRLKHET